MGAIRERRIPRRMVSILASIGLVTGMLTATPGVASAFGYVDTGFDPDDTPAGTTQPDIRTTTRKVWANDGHRRLVVTIRSYEPLSEWWAVFVRLDTRGGPLTDYKMLLANSDVGGTACQVRPASSRQSHPGTFRQEGSTATCRVPLRYVWPNKPIRWKLYSTWWAEDRDLAPNGRGWYG